MHKEGFMVWLTGLSGAGKTTIAQQVAQALKAQGLAVEILDGDVMREKLTKELGFSRKDREENLRRIAFVAHLLMRHGVIVLVAAVSPYRHVREEARQKVGRFVEVFVNAPLEVCQMRDPKGIYQRAKKGELSQISGLDDIYEPPLSPDVVCRTDQETPDESASKVMQALERLGYLPQSA
jgi:adenylylsulfate kinase